MARRILTAAVLWCGVVAVGCRDDDVPSPQFNAGVSVEGRTLLPTVPPRQADATILGAAASAEEVGSAARPARGEGAGPGKGPAVEVDDSTAEGLINGCIAMRESGQHARIAGLVVPEQQAIVRELLDATLPMMQAMEELRTTWAARFPETPMGGMFGSPEVNLLSAPKLVGVESQTDTEAEATVEEPGLPEPVRIKLRKIDNAWRMELPNIPPVEQMEQFRRFAGVWGEVARAAQDIARRMGENEFNSASQAQEAMRQAMAKAFAPMFAEMLAQAGQGAPGAAKVGGAAPDFTLTATDGTVYRRADLAGKTVLLDFWASWCMPCVAEIPNVRALREGTKDRADFVMIGVSLDQSEAAFEAAVGKHGIDWPQAFGPKSGAQEAAALFGAVTIPHTCLIGPDGKVVAQGLRGPTLADDVKKLLAAPGAGATGGPAPGSPPPPAGGANRPARKAGDNRAEKQKERTPDEVDGTYSGPGMLRRR